MIHVYYRISDSGYRKDKPPYITKENCLKNFLSCFPNVKLNLLGDNINNPALKDLTNSVPGATVQFTKLGNAASFKYCFESSLKHPSEDIAYFVEDDYVHRKGSDIIMLEGFNLGAEYVSLYDHPDKYMENVNPYVSDGGEETKVFLSKSCHWKFTNSTTMTFAAKIKTLQEDSPIIQSFVSSVHPNDFQMFCKLREIGRSLVTPIPGYSTHGETPWLTPLTDWEKEIKLNLHQKE